MLYTRRPDSELGQICAQIEALEVYFPMKQTSPPNSYCIKTYGQKSEGISDLITFKYIQNIVSSSPDVRIARFLSLTSITFRDERHGMIHYLKICGTQTVVPQHMKCKAYKQRNGNTNNLSGQNLNGQSN